MSSIRLTDWLAEQIERRPQLAQWILLFNLLPVAMFASLVLAAAVLNFGFALVFQIVAIVICLAWLIPTLIFCSAGAFICHFFYNKLQEFMHERRPAVNEPKTTHSPSPTPIDPNESVVFADCCSDNEFDRSPRKAKLL